MTIKNRRRSENLLMTESLQMTENLPKTENHQMTENLQTIKKIKIETAVQTISPGQRSKIEKSLTRNHSTTSLRTIRIKKIPGKSTSVAIPIHVKNTKTNPTTTEAMETKIPETVIESRTLSLMESLKVKAF